MSAHDVQELRWDPFDVAIDVAPYDTWRRLRDEVLGPLRAGQVARYQRYDWSSDALAEWHDVPQGIVIVEGVYSTRLELEQFYDLTVWVECPRSICLARGVERDGEAARRKWEEEWMPAEDHYISEQSPHTRANIVYTDPAVAANA